MSLDVAFIFQSVRFISLLDVVSLALNFLLRKIHENSLSKGASICEHGSPMPIPCERFFFLDRRYVFGIILKIRSGALSFWYIDISIALPPPTKKFKCERAYKQGASLSRLRNFFHKTEFTQAQFIVSSSDALESLVANFL